MSSTLASLSHQHNALNPSPVAILMNIDTLIISSLDSVLVSTFTMSRGYTTVIKTGRNAKYAKLILSLKDIECITLYMMRSIIHTLLVIVW